MDTGLLQTFRQVARHGSITAAAQALGYTQSAVSRQVAALESSLGVRLFDRVARGAQLTEHGRTLLPHADSLIQRMDDARADLEALDLLDHGRVRVGAFPTAGAVLLPRALAAFGVRHPRVSTSLVEGTSRRQLARLRAGDVDLAVISALPGQPPDADAVDLVHLLDDPLLVALPGSHRLAGRRKVRLAELADERWIAADTGEDARLLGPASLRLGFEPRVDFIVGEWTAKLGLVAAGLGITLVASIAAEAARSDIALVAVHPDDASARAVHVATPRTVTASPATDAFMEILRETAAGGSSP